MGTRNLINDKGYAMQGGKLADQLSWRPVVNDRVEIRDLESGLELSIPFDMPGWYKLLRRALPLSTRKRIQLDAMGRAVLDMCDGEHTLEQIIDWLCARYRLSFFESRGVVVDFIGSLTRRGYILVACHGETTDQPACLTEDV